MNTFMLAPQHDQNIGTNNQRTKQHNGSDGTELVLLVICPALITVSIAVLSAATLGITAAVGFIVRHFVVIQRCTTCNFVKNFFMLVVTHMPCAQPFCLWLFAGIRQVVYNGDPVQAFDHATKRKKQPRLSAFVRNDDATD
jgi:hypothetical protein